MTIPEINHKLESIIDFYALALDTYTDSGFLQKKAEDIWSVGQMYEHLVNSARFFMYQVKNCLEKRKGSLEGGKNDLGEKAYRHNSFPPIKIKIPELWKGAEPIVKTQDEYRQLLRDLLSDLKKLGEEVLLDDLSYKTPHAAWGMLNSLEWYQLTEMHFRHHLRQKEELDDFLKLKSSLNQ